MSKYIRKIKPVKPIIYIIADNNYSIFHYTDGTKMMFATTLKKLEDKGIRIHKSVIVNPECIKELLTSVSGWYYVQMKDNSVHPVARRRVGVLNTLEFNSDYTKVKRLK